MRVVSSHGIPASGDGHYNLQTAFFSPASREKYDFHHGRWKRGSSLWARYFFVTSQPREQDLSAHGSHESIFIGQTDNLSAPLGSQTLSIVSPNTAPTAFACTWCKRGTTSRCEQDLIAGN